MLTPPLRRTGRIAGGRRAPRLCECVVRGPGTGGGVCSAPQPEILEEGTIVLLTAELSESGAPFTKYLTTILRLSYDNAKVTISLRRTSNLQNSLQ